MLRVKWPESVPVLTADDMYRGRFTSPCGQKHCLLGWVYAIFTNPVASVRSFRAIELVSGSENIASLNDDPNNSEAKIAQIWNDAMHELGYTEVEYA